MVVYVGTGFGLLALIALIACAHFLERIFRTLVELTDLQRRVAEKLGAIPSRLSVQRT